MTAELTIPSTNIPEQITARKSRVEKAVSFVKTIPDTIKDDDTDEKAKSLIVKYKALHTALTDERMPITKRFDEIKSVFISDEKTVLSAIEAISKKRDAFVAWKQDEIKKQQAAALKERYKIDERIDITAKIETIIREHVINMIERKKMGVLNALKTVNNENKDEMFAKLQQMSTEIDSVYLGSIPIVIPTRFDNNVTEIHNEVLKAIETQLCEQYRKEIDTFKHDCILQFNNLTKLSDEDKAAVIDTKASEVLIDTQAAIEVTNVEAAQKTDVAKAESSFTAIADSIDNSLPSHSEGFEIEVLNNAGWKAIAVFWLTTMADKFTGNWETKTIKSMKGDLEKLAKDDGVKIVSENVVYTQKIKARN